MRPVTLEMTGFGAFRETTTVDLADVDLFALVGATGAGKSTVIDAITFALYGSVARYGHNGMVAPAINQRSQEAKLRLDFEVAGQMHTAVRVVRRTKRGATTREARLERGDEIIAANAIEMTEAVERLLGLDVDQFNRTVVLPQGQFSDFLRASAGDRQRTLRRLLGFELYAQMGKRARQQATDGERLADALASELTERADDLSAGRRRELDRSYRALAKARDKVAELLDSLAGCQRQLDATERELEELSERGAALDELATPADLDQLEQLHTTAETDAEAAKARVADARRSRDEARQAVADGPRVDELRSLIEAHQRHAKLVGSLDQLDTSIAALDTRLATAQHTVDRLTSDDAKLERAVDEARTRAAQAQTELEQLPRADELERMGARRRSYRELDSRAAEQRQQLDEAARRVAELHRDLADAKTRAEAAAAECQRARELAGVAGHRHLLRAGEPCPLCDQTVNTIPDRGDDLPDELAGAVDAAQTQLEAVTGDHEAAVGQHRRLEAMVNASTDQLESLARELDGLPDDDEIADGIARYRDAVSAANDLASDLRNAEQELAEARRNPERVAAKRELEGAAGERATAQGRRDQIAHEVEQLADMLTDAAPLATLIDQRDRAAALAEQLRVTDGELDAAEQHRTTTQSALDGVRKRSARLTTQLQAAREATAAFGPPASDADSVFQRWRDFDTWLATTRRKHHKSVETLTKRLDKEHTALTKVEEKIRSAAAPLGADIVIAEVGERLAVAVARAESALDQFDRDRADFEQASERIERYRKEAAVARELGRLLQADRFEQWLMRSALEQLVERGTERLIELSGGQYSLVLADDDSFAVRDHANADETRSAVTLSGGETFLASLSLALALSESTADLAPDGAPGIESIFLDEGFGTLDPDTLDVVASAIEELGASGRMVGIITHIRELADRMPVRLEVRRTPNGAEVERREQ